MFEFTNCALSGHAHPCVAKACTWKTDTFLSRDCTMYTDTHACKQSLMGAHMQVNLHIPKIF